MKTNRIWTLGTALFCLHLLAGCCDCAEEPKPAANVTRTAAQPTMVDPKSVFGKIRVVSIGEDYKIRYVSIGENFTIRFVSIGEGFVMERVD